MNDLVLSPLAMMEGMDSDDLCLYCNRKQCCSKTDCIFICKDYINFNKEQSLEHYHLACPAY